LVDVTPFLKVDDHLAQPEKFETRKKIHDEEKSRELLKTENLKVFLFNESKLADIEKGKKSLGCFQIFRP
jgi:hypothetical protein